MAYEGQNLDEIIIRDVSVKLARTYISAYHYLHSVPDSTRECYGGYFNDNLAAVLTFGTGCSNNVFSSVWSKATADTSRELTRLWSPDGMPKNTESKFVSACLKRLDKNVNLVVSFADPAQHHIGRIYQATNFFFVGMSSAGVRYVDENGNEVHARNLGIYRMRHPEYRDINTPELLKILKWTEKDTEGKYKYVYIRPRCNKEKIEMMKELQPLIKPYPKEVAEEPLNK